MSDRRLAGRDGLAALLMVAFAVLSQGCGGDATTEPPPAATGDAPVRRSSGEAARERYLAGAISILSELERYDEQQAAEQVFERLVQWGHASGVGGGGAGSLASLPDPLRRAAEPIVVRSTFDAGGDVLAIRDRVWLAAAARTARADAEEGLAVAENLFRWTVRTLAPVSDPPMVPTEALPGSRWFLPGEILLSGRGSAAQRAWVFVTLLAQEGMDGVMLGLPGADGTVRPWLPAALIGGEAYLFDAGYGMPIPGPGGGGVATLRQAAADPAILAAMSLPDRPYPVASGDLAAVVPLVVADPWSLAPRMVRLDADLRRRHGIAVAVDLPAIAARSTAALRGPAAEAGPPTLWTFPFETLARRPQAAAAAEQDLMPLATSLAIAGPSGTSRRFRPLFAGRVREFRGDLEGPRGAKDAYLKARPSRAEITRLVAGLPPEQAAAMTARLALMKEDATYWLGTLMVVEGQYGAAVDYLQRMMLDTSPDTRWADAARIQLAAALAGLDRRAEAAAILRRDDSPQRFGSQLVAARLEREAKSAGGGTTDGSPPVAPTDAPERPESAAPAGAGRSAPPAGDGSAGPPAAKRVVSPPSAG